VRRRYLRHSAILIVGAALVLLFAEMGARVIFPRVSRLEQRVIAEREAALKINDPKAILLVGNSFLGEGWDQAVVDAQLAQGQSAVRYFVDDTRYHDWYYGLRRLFAEGSRPGTVVVVLNLRQLIGNTIRGDYSVRRLVMWRDIHRLAHDIDADMTRTTNLYFARGSAFMSSRAEIRAWLMGVIVPRFTDLAKGFRPRNPEYPKEQDVLDGVHERLKSLKEMAAEHGARIVVVIPPHLNKADGREDLVRRAMVAAPAPLWLPLSSDETTEADYQEDTFHLNEKGRRRFSERLGKLLRELPPP
jgi:hypothetical protein